MSVVCPADPVETRLALRAAVAYDRPVYIRLGKKGEPKVHTDEPAFAIGRGLVMREGADVCLWATGTVMPVVLQAAEHLAAHGISAHVVNCHTVKPLDADLLERATKKFRLLVTIEEHSVIGGLGGAVAEWMMDRNVSGVRLVRVGVPDAFVHGAVEQDEAREHVGLTAERIAERTREAFMAARGETR